MTESPLRTRQPKQGVASQSFYQWAPVAAWLSWARDFFSPALLRAMALQLGLIGIIFAVVWVLRSWMQAAVERVAGRYLRSEWIRAELQPLAVLVCAWLLLVTAD